METMNKITNISKRQHAPKFKAQVAREAIKGEKTVAQIASDSAVHTTQVNKWRRIADEGLPSLFSDNQAKQLAEKDREIEQLHAAVGKREVELDWLKKRLGA
jgi:transposase-like protein